MARLFFLYLSIMVMIKRCFISFRVDGACFPVHSGGKNIWASLVDGRNIN